MSINKKVVNMNLNYLKDEFRKDLIYIINKYSLENDSDSPDWLLAQYIISCLGNFDSTVRGREIWHGRYKDEKSIKT